MHTNRHWPFAALLLPLLGAACLTPGEPPRIRYYSALPHTAGSGAAEDGAPTAAPEASGASATVDASVPQRVLRVRRVGAAEHLALRFVWSEDGIEYGYRELERWTEDPADYARKALEDALYSTTFRRSELADAFQLDVELRTFEERLEPERRALVALQLQLSDADGRGLVEELVVGETPIGEGDEAATARAMATSLAVAVTRAVQIIDEATR